MKKSSKRHVSVPFYIFVLLVLLPIVTFFIGGSIMSPQTNNTSTNTTSQKFTDSTIPGFSFYYDSTVWNVTSEDIIYGTDAVPTTSVTPIPPKGRSIILTHKTYPDIPEWIALSINLEEETPFFPQDANTPICFEESDIVDIGSGWFRAKNPYYSDATQNNEKIWDRYYYRKQSLTEVDGKKCVIGALNDLGPTVPVIYRNMEMPIIMNVELRNMVSPELSNIADDIVKSISFD